MKLIIAGGRDLDPTFGFLMGAVRLLKLWNITEIVSGMAEGVDKAGEMFASEMLIPVKHFEADWLQHGKAAGPIRNRQMAEYADQLLLIWDGKSKGSANMKKEMLKAGKIVHEVLLQGHLRVDTGDIV